MRVVDPTRKPRAGNRIASCHVPLISSRRKRPPYLLRRVQSLTLKQHVHLSPTTCWSGRVSHPYGAKYLRTLGVLPQQIALQFERGFPASVKSLALLLPAIASLGKSRCTHPQRALGFGECALILPAGKRDHFAGEELLKED